MSVQLLCTFCRRDSLNETVDQILDWYELAASKIYVLENVDDPKQFILTYNIKNDPGSHDIMESTISVHRKKQTNTIYTINALNQLIMDKNDGVLDKKFKIDWSELQNTVVVTAFGRLKKIPTKIYTIMDL